MADMGMLESMLGYFGVEVKIKRNLGVTNTCLSWMIVTRRPRFHSDHQWKNQTIEPDYSY